MLVFLFLLSATIDVDFQIERDTNLVPYVIVRYKIPYSEISFYKNDSIYEARYSAALIVKKDNRQVGGKNIRKGFVLKDYLKTISSTEHTVGTFKQELSSGEYKIILNVWDLQSSKNWSWEKDLSISGIAPLDICSMRWLSGPTHVITTRDTLKIKIIVFDRESVGAHLYYYYESEKGGIYFKSDTLLEGRRMYTVCIELPADKFPEAHYKFSAHLKDINDKGIRQSSLEFVVQEPFFKSERFISRVKQLQYIATPKEIEELVKAPPGKRVELWNEFWRKRDPTSGDEVNEFREEYFGRVDYAQAHFSTGLTEGWKSDRGKAYITLGPPDYIEHHPFEMERKAYQIWYYYDRGYRLVFVERYNLGEYELINPPRGFL